MIYSIDVINFYISYITEELGEESIDILRKLFDILLDNSDYIIIDKLVDILNIYKRSLKRILVRSYTLNKDYFIESKHKNNEQIYVTLSTFKHLCLHKIGRAHV